MSGEVLIAPQASITGPEIIDAYRKMREALPRGRALTEEEEAQKQAFLSNPHRLEYLGRSTSCAAQLGILIAKEALPTARYHAVRDEQMAILAASLKDKDSAPLRAEIKDLTSSYPAFSRIDNARRPDLHVPRELLGSIVDFNEHFLRVTAPEGEFMVTPVSGMNGTPLTEIEIIP